MRPNVGKDIEGPGGWHVDGTGNKGI